MTESGRTNADGGSEGGEVFPLSLEQESFFGPYPVADPVIAQTHRISGPLSRAHLDAAITELLRRHEALRFRIAHRGDETVQYFVDPAAYAIRVSETDHERLWASVADAHAEPLDLTVHGPIRFHLLRISDDEHFLTTTAHPASVDAWGIGLVGRELWKLYECIRADRELPAPPSSFREHVLRQRAAGTEPTETRRSKQTRRIAALKHLALPDPTAARDARLHWHERFRISEEDLAELSAAARGMRITVAAAFLAAFELALAITGDTDHGGLSCIYAGRDSPESGSMAAATARRVPIEFVLEPDEPVLDFVRRAMREWAVAISDSRPPYSAARMLRALGGPLTTIEPVFNFRVFQGSSTSEPSDESAQPSPHAVEVEHAHEPTPRPIPMWSQFGTAALFAVVTQSAGASISAIYDPEAVSEPLVGELFTIYERVLGALRSRESDVTVGQIRRALKSAA